MRLRPVFFCLLFAFPILSCVACGSTSSGGGAGGAGAADAGVDGNAGAAGTGDSKDCPAVPPSVGDFCGDTFMDSSDCHYELSCSSGPQRVHFRCQNLGAMYVEPEPCTPGDTCEGNVVCDQEGHWRQDQGTGCPWSPPLKGEPCEPATCYYRCLENEQMTRFDCSDTPDGAEWLDSPACGN
ncbi:MAG: hypothetical protein R3B07_19385 [Polyangiaceae bacterium]